MTFSVGLRAPGVNELVADFAEFLAERLPEEWRYADPDLKPARDPGAIDAEAVRRVRALLRDVLDCDGDIVAEWFGRFITRYRIAGLVSPRNRPFAPAAFARRLDSGRGVLVRHPLSRFAWQARGRGAVLYVAGEPFPCTTALARRLCDPRPLPVAEAARLDGAGRELLRQLANAGHLEFAR